MNLNTATATGFSPERPWWSVQPRLLALLAIATAALAAVTTYSPVIVRHW